MRLQEAANRKQPLLLDGASQRLQSEPIQRIKARSSSKPDEMLVGAEKYLQRDEYAQTNLVMYTVL